MSTIKTIEYTNYAAKTTPIQFKVAKALVYSEAKFIKAISKTQMLKKSQSLELLKVANMSLKNRIICSIGSKCIVRIYKSYYDNTQSPTMDVFIFESNSISSINKLMLTLGVLKVKRHKIKTVTFNEKIQKR